MYRGGLLGVDALRKPRLKPACCRFTRESLTDRDSKTEDFRSAQDHSVWLIENQWKVISLIPLINSKPSYYLISLIHSAVTSPL